MRRKNLETSHQDGINLISITKPTHQQSIEKTKMLAENLQTAESRAPLEHKAFTPVERKQGELVQVKEGYV